MTIDEIIKNALAEDIGEGDHTSQSIIPPGRIGKAKLLVKEAGIIAGVDIARKVFLQVDPRIVMRVKIEDGARVEPGDVVFEVEGPSISLLMAERTMLNFIQRMSGIATQTRRIVDELKELPTVVLDTRKTTPLLRELEKLAVRIGGGQNHRFGLYDMVLIKDNHVDFAGGISKAIGAARSYLEQKNLHLKIEIEVRNLEELDEVLKVGGVDRIMLDNFEFAALREAVQRINHQYETEASGGININTVRDYAECGVDFVSVGSLTHHISSLDLSFKAVN